MITTIITNPPTAIPIRNPTFNALLESLPELMAVCDDRKTGETGKHSEMKKKSLGSAIRDCPESGVCSIEAEREKLR
jgi:hypothetical protein